MALRSFIASLGLVSSTTDSLLPPSLIRLRSSLYSFGGGGSWSGVTNRTFLVGNSGDCVGKADEGSDDVDGDSDGEACRKAGRWCEDPDGEGARRTRLLELGILPVSAVMLNASDWPSRLVLLDRDPSSS